MRISTLTMVLTLAAATTLPGLASAHDRGTYDYGRGHAYGHRPPAVIVYPGYRPHHHGWRGHGYDARRSYRPHYRHHDHGDGDGERWGIQLFYGNG